MGIRMKITMKIPRIIIQVAEIIQQQLSISPEKDKVIDISLWDFRDPDKENDLIPKEDLKKILRALEEKDCLKLIDTKCLDKTGRFNGESVKIKIDRQKFEDFYAKNALPKEDHGKRFPGQLPAGTQWKDIIIKFLDAEHVLIQVHGHQHEADFRAMGLANKKNDSKCNVQWAFLFTLSEQPNPGELLWGSKDAEIRNQKLKQRLSKSLKYYFGLSDDPFFPYEPFPPFKHERSYKTRFNLFPCTHDKDDDPIRKEVAEMLNNYRFEEE
jgi:hypothetical protein